MGGQIQWEYIRRGLLGPAWSQQTRLSPHARSNDAVLLGGLTRERGLWTRLERKCRMEVVVAGWLGGGGRQG
jgi:hypothetical protein